MSIPYRTRRVLNRLGLVLMIFLLVGVIAWLCWVVWLERYVVYTANGASLDFEHSSQDIIGEVATPPVAQQKISIYYNEGSDALDTGNELTQINGYYISSNMLQNDINGVLGKLERLPAGTPVMIDMKGPYGSFFYPSHLDGAVHSASTDVIAVAALVDTLMNKKFYTIARVCSLRDWNFGNEHVTCGLYMLSRAGLWLDQGYFWLDPTNATTISWITSVVLELKEMGFNEVMLADFRFPNSDQYIFNGDKDAALQDAASKLMGTCGGSDFTLSFGVSDPTFPLPDGRCRMYLEDVDAAEPFYIAADSPAIRACIDTYNEVTGENATPFTMGGGTYARHFPYAVSFGPEHEDVKLPEFGGPMHGANEAAPIDKLLEAVKIYILALLRLEEIDF